MKGAFGNEGALRFFSKLANSTVRPRESTRGTPAYKKALELHQEASQHVRDDKTCLEATRPIALGRECEVTTLMKLQDARDIYERRSTNLSDVVRQLNFAGIAIIWLLRTGDNTLPYSKGLLWPLGLFAGSATFDLFHYAYATAAWGIFYRLQEKKPENNAETEIHVPGAINWISFVFLWGKTGLTIAAYCFLVVYIFDYLARPWSLAAR
jgi:hypothetical protein